MIISRWFAEQSTLETVIESEERDLGMSALSDAMSDLLPSYRKVLSLRFGLDDSEAKTCREVGRILGLSYQRISQLEKESLQAIREKISC